MPWKVILKPLDAALGLSNPEERLAKAKLAMQIDHLLIKKRLTKKQAAKILEISQLKISALLRGRLAEFSIANLQAFLKVLD